MMSENEDDYNDDNDADEDKKDSSSILTADKKNPTNCTVTHIHTSSHAHTHEQTYSFFNYS